MILSSAVIMASKGRCFKGLRQIFLYYLKAKLLKMTLLEDSYSHPGKFTTNQLLCSNDVCQSLFIHGKKFIRSKLHKKKGNI